MDDLGDLVRSSVDAALEAQRRDAAAPAHDVKTNVIRRGRRRLAVRVSVAVVMSAVLFAGAASATAAFLRRDVTVAAREVPALGAERVYGIGGPIASDGSSLWIGSGATSNTKGDRNGVTRLDIATGESVDGPPSIGNPGAMAVGASGIWTVGWSGDMPLGGEGHPVRGAIERVDAVTLERNGYIPREDSAPYDVAVGTVDGREVAWVVDAGRDELLRVDAATMQVDEVYDAPRMPVSVLVHDRFVYVTSSKDHVVTRMDVETEKTTAFEVPECANEAAVGDGSLWVVDYCGNALLRIDEEGSEEMVSVKVDHPSAVEYADGLVWVVSTPDVLRVDPGTNQVVGDPIYVGEMNEGLLYAGGSMWVESLDGIYRLDEDVPPATPPPTPAPTPDPRDEPMPAGVERVDAEGYPAVLAYGADSLWAASFEVVRLDPATGAVEAEIDPGGFVRSMDFDEAAGILWAFVEVAEKETNAVVAIDPDTDEVVLGPVLVDPPGVYGQAMAAHDGVAWVAGDPMLYRIDLATGDVERTDIGRHFGDPDDTSGFNAIATDEAVLVVPGNGTVVRVDPDTLQSQKVADLGWNASDLVTDGDTVWLVQTTPPGEIMLWTLDGATGRPQGEPVAVAKYGREHLAQHDGLVWVAQSAMQKEPVVVEAYEQGAGVPVKTIELPGTDFAEGAAAGPGAFWLTTGHDFLYRVDAE